MNPHAATLDNAPLSPAFMATKINNFKNGGKTQSVSKPRHTSSPLSQATTISEEGSVGDDAFSSTSSASSTTPSSINNEDTEDTNLFSTSKAAKAAESIFQAYLSVPTPKTSSLPRRKPLPDVTQYFSVDARSHCNFLSQSLYDERHEARALANARRDALARAWWNQATFEHLPYCKHIRMRHFEDGIERSFRHEVFWNAWVTSMLKREDEQVAVCRGLPWHGHGRRPVELPQPKQQVSQVTDLEKELKKKKLQDEVAEEESEIAQLEADAKGLDDPTGEMASLIKHARDLHVQMCETLEREERGEGINDDEDDVTTEDPPTWSFPPQQDQTHIKDRQSEVHAACLLGESSDEETASPASASSSSKSASLKDEEDIDEAFLYLSALREKVVELEADLQEERTQKRWRDAEDTEMVLTASREHVKVLEKDLDEACADRPSTLSSDERERVDEALEAWIEAQRYLKEEVLELEDEFALDGGEYI